MLAAIGHIWYDTIRSRHHPVTYQFPFDNSYARLPDRFFARVAPARRESPSLIAVNTRLARELGISYAICCVVVNQAAGRSPSGVGIHTEIAAHLAAGLSQAEALVQTFLRAN